MALRIIPLLLFISALSLGVSAKKPILILRDAGENKVLEQGIRKRVRQVSQAGSKTATWEVWISFPGLKKYQRVRWDGSSSISFSEDTISFNTNNLTDSLLLEGEGIPSVQLETTILTDSSSCKRFGIQLKPVGAKLKHEVQLFCINSEEKILMYIYPPSQVQIDHSELRRNLSEGNAWKSYWVKKEDSSVCFPYLVFKEKKKKFPYFICGATEDLEIDEQINQSRLLLVSGDNVEKFLVFDQKNFFGLFWMGLGAIQLGIQSQPQTFTDLRPVISLRTHPISLWKDLSLTALFSYSFPISSKLQSLSYSLLEGKLHYDFSLGQSFRLRPMASYLRIQFEDELTRLGLTGGQSSVGLEGYWLVSSDWRAELGLSTMPFSSGVLSSNQTVQLGLTKITPDEQMYGGHLQWQNISLLTASDDKIQLSQLSLQFFWRF